MGLVGEGSAGEGWAVVAMAEAEAGEEAVED